MCGSRGDNDGLFGLECSSTGPSKVESSAASASNNRPTKRSDPISVADKL